MRVKTSSLAVLCLLAIACLGSPTASAALCSNVFPQDATPDTGSTLDLAVMDRQAYGPFPSRGAAYATAGDYFYNAGKLDNGKTISVTAGRPVRMFVDGDLELAPHSRINPNGSASDLLIVVRGNLSIGTKNDINALVYVTGDVTANPSAHIEGALTAEGSIDTKVKDTITYDEVAASAFAQGDLCQDSENIPLYLRFDEASWGVPANTGRGAFDIQVLGGAVTAGVDPALATNQQGEGTCRYGAFNGGLVSIAHDSALNFTDKLSASFWLKIDSLPKKAVTVVDKGTNYKLELTSAGTLVLTAKLDYFLDDIFGASYLAVESDAIEPGDWVHAGFDLALKARGEFIVWKSIEGSVWVNDLREQGSSAAFITGRAAVNDQDAKVGGDSFSGKIDEFRLERLIWPAKERLAQREAVHWCGKATSIDHFEFTTSALAHTCSPQTVTLMACTNAPPGACQPYLGDVSVILRGEGWFGGNQQTLRGGVGTFKLQGLQLQMPLAVDASEPDALRSTLCRIGDAPLSSDCLLNFAQSGFIFDVPDMQAGRGQSIVPMRAVIDVGDEGSPRCEPAFTDSTREVRFWSSFVTPSVSELSDSSKPVQVNAESVGQSFAEARSFALRFDQNGATSLDVNYAEAGRMLLNAYYPGSAEEGDSGPMSGSDDFVSAPAGFCITPEESCSSGDSNCPAFRQVGQPFEVTIRPVAWNAGGNICAGMTTRNYRQNDLKLEPVLVAPAASDNSGEVLVPATRSYDHTTPGSATAWNGEITQNVAFSEVGVFRLQVAPPIDAYFGVTVPSSASEPIGRFYPTHLKVEGEGALAAGCGVFSYQDQPIDIATPLTLTITGYGRVEGGGEYITENYDYDGFWKFEDRPAEVWKAADRELDLSDRLLLDDDGVTERGQNDRDGKRTYTWDAKRLSYTRSPLPTAGDLPFSIRQRFSAAELTDKDGACYDLGTSCQGFEQTIADSEIRLGRLRIANAHGSEQLPLALPWMIESWQVPGVFLPEEGDICSASAWSEPDLIEPTGDLAAITAPEVSTIKAGHQGVLTVAAPEVTGSGRVGFPKVPKWLWYDWRGEGWEPSRGLATFGIYQGPKPLIFRREVYR